MILWQKLYFDAEKLENFKKIVAYVCSRCGSSQERQYEWSINNLIFCRPL